jgi:effector-binding domain-containing protein
MSYKVEIREIEPVRVAYTKFKGDASKANKLFPNVFKAIHGNVNGAPFFYFHSFDPATKIGEIDLCVPSEMEAKGNGVEVKEIPGMKMICTTHVGSYDLLYKAYEAINQYAMQNRIRLGVPYKEVYIKGPGMLIKGNPDNYITEIAFPFKEE